MHPNSYPEEMEVFLTALAALGDDTARTYLGEILAHRRIARMLGDRHYDVDDTFERHLDFLFRTMRTLANGADNESLRPYDCDRSRYWAAEAWVADATEAWDAGTIEEWLRDDGARWAADILTGILEGS